MDPVVRHPLREAPALLDVRLPFVALVEHALAPAQCDRLIERIESLAPALAPIETAGGAVVNTRVRNNERVLFDDAPLAAELFAPARVWLPRTLDRGALLGFNERFRGYRYRDGQRFQPHFDGAYFRPETPAGREGSQLTVLFYLNDGFTGGSTRFLDYELDVAPKKGAALFFEHAMLHEGAPVTEGTKYVLRTDVMYWFARPEDEARSKETTGERR